MTFLECLGTIAICLIGSGAFMFLFGSALVRYSSADAPEAWR